MLQGLSLSSMSVTSLLREQAEFRFSYLRILAGWTKEPLIRPYYGAPQPFLPNKGLPKNGSNRGLCFVASVFFLLDGLLGILLWLFVSHGDRRQLCNETFLKLTYSAMNVTQSGIQWLMGAPAGLKLNTPLTHFIGGHISGILGAWQLTFDTVAFGGYKEEFFTAVWLLFGIASLCGFSVQVALVLDVMKVFVGYILAFYNIFALLHSIQLSILFSLLRLFLGRKWNPLRQRTDSYKYDSSQLTIGTLLLSMSVFLFPTVAVYYALFLVLKAVLSVPRYLGRVGLVTINRFTILPLLIYLKWSKFKLSQTKLYLEPANASKGSVDTSSSKEAEQKQPPLSQMQENRFYQQQPLQKGVELVQSPNVEPNKDTECTSKLSNQQPLVKSPPLLQQQQTQCAVRVAHPKFSNQSIDLFQFQEFVKSLGNTYITKEYFVKESSLMQLPTSVNSLTALLYFTPSLFPRIIYLIKCSTMGLIFDF